MTKLPSKVDGLRALREARHVPVPRESKKPPKSEVVRAIEELIDPKPPAIDLQPAKPKPHVATKRKKRTAEAIGKVREGKMQLAVWIEADLYREVKIAIAEDLIKQEAWVEKVLREYLEERARG